MVLYVNVNSGAVLASPNGYTSTPTFQAILGPSEPLAVQYGAPDPDTGVWTPTLVPTTAGMILGAKPQGTYSGAFDTSCSAFTAPGSAAGFYTGVLPTNTAAINTALGTSNNPDTIASVTLGAEIDFVSPITGQLAKSQPFVIQVNNTYITGNEGATVPANPTFPSWNVIKPFLRLITALTGGTASDLDGILTAGGVAPDGVEIPNVRPSATTWQNVPSPGISAITVDAANPQVTTSTPHNLLTGQTATLGGTNSTPDIDGDHVVTVIDNLNFTVAGTTTAAGTAGFATPAAVAGSIVRPADFNAATNARTWQSV